MDSESYQRARQVFHAACELVPETRARYLDEACAGRPDIRREVESLFAQERRSLADALDKPLAEIGLLQELASAASRGAPEPPVAESGLIGRYRLLERIGEGGFGTVYLAEQTEPVVRRVALKIIKPGMDTEQVIARFEGERQALALMDHPGIARVLDAGTTDGARPYFVMELVQGEPITRHCDREKLSMRQRLELFRDVCGAVQHAHQKGIVHRDLKPTNVLVSESDGRTLPKVIDFGIAKATAGRLTDKSVLTGLHQMIGTPQYMSPEQAGGSGLDVDTRSDIYALGVLLYELLVGSTPLDDRRVRSATLAEVQRMIREEEPQRPSLRLSESLSAEAESRTPVDRALERDVADIARCRGTDPTALIRQLRGDVDWIVLKCLEKDRARRFATASALAEDIGRYLDHQPVLASPPSTSYRLRKFVRRNRSAVVASAVGAVALSSATVVSLVFGLREARQREEADLAKARAEIAEEAAEARASELEQVAGFQQEQLAGFDVQTMGVRLREDLLAQVRASAARTLPPGDVEARVAELEVLIAGSNFTGLALDALDHHYFQPARAAIETQFGGQPLVEARLLQTLASTMEELGLLDAATEPQRTALEIRRRELGEGHPGTIASIHATGRLLLAQGDLAEAELSLREALEQYRRASGDDHPSTLAALGDLGVLLKIKGDFAGAELCYREALEKQLRVLGEEHPDTLTSLNNMGALLQAQGRPAEAEPLFLQVLEANRRLLGGEHPKTLWAINNLGGLLYTQGKLADAERYFREALEQCSRVLGDRHPDTLMALNNLGGLLQAQGRFSEAEPYYRETLEKRRLVLGDAHQKTLNTLNNLGGLLKELGRLAEAESCYREALEKRRETLGLDHPDTIASINNLGWLLEGAGRVAEAEECYREALERYRSALGDGHPQTLIAAGNLSNLLRAQGRPTEALAVLAPAEPAIRLAFTGGNPMHLCRALTVLGRCRVAIGEFAAAEANLLEAHVVLGEAENATDQQREDVLTGLVELYDGWDAAEPDPARRGKAAEWSVRLAGAQARPGP